MIRRARQSWAVAAYARGGYFLIYFLDRVRPVPNVVANLVGQVIFGLKPSASFESHDFQSRARQRKHGEASCCAQANHDHVGLRQLNGSHLSVLLRKPWSEESWRPSFAFADRRTFWPRDIRSIPILRSS